jgi:signal transduction histidine kinase
MLTDAIGYKERPAPPLAGRCADAGSDVGNSAEMVAWAEILSMIGDKNSRLYLLLAHESVPRSSESSNSGRLIVRELERERSRIARELHAGAGQPLAGIKLNLEILDDFAAALPEAGREALARLQTLAEQALEQIRAVSHSLHPPDWQGLTTGDALRYLLQSSGLMARLKVEMDIQPLRTEPSHTVKIALYRCAQECISNVARHSGATRFSLSLALIDAANSPAANGPMVELRLEDNGRGFPSGASSAGNGIGLLAIREHTRALGGICHISSGSEGVGIRVQLPLAGE